MRSSDEIVDLEEGDSNEAEVTRGEQLSPVAKLCLFKELACNIKLSLFSHRKGDPVCSLTLSFDSLHFEALVHRAIRRGTRGKTVMYGLSSLSKLDDLLGDRWYIRGLNRAGDFCYVEPGSV